jgi:excisionase family DNA binding protein
MAHVDVSGYAPGRSALEPLLTFAEVCEIFAVSRKTLYRLIDTGAIRPIRIGHRPRFRPADIRALLEARSP